MADARMFNYDPYACQPKPPRPGRPRVAFDGEKNTYSIHLPALTVTNIRQRALFVTMNPGGKMCLKLGPSTTSIEIPFIPPYSVVTSYVVDRTITGESSDPGDVLRFTATYRAPARPGPLRVKRVERLGPPRPGKLRIAKVERLGPPRPGRLRVVGVERLGPPRPQPLHIINVERLGPPRPGTLRIKHAEPVYATQSAS